MVTINEEDYLAHYGTPRHSGRYPWGSGGDKTTPRNATFLDTVRDLRRQGLTDSEIAKGLGLESSTQLRAKYSMYDNERQMARILMAEELKAKGNSNGAIAARMGLPGESSVRALLAPGAKEKAQALTNISDMLKRQVEEKKFLDIGTGQEAHIGISKEKLNVAVAMLKEQGYEVHTVNHPQQGTGFDTKMKVLTPPGTTQRDVFLNRDKIQHVAEFTNDGGHTYGKIHPPIAINPNRVKVVYKEEGGDKADGVIYVRPGVQDVSLGKTPYAQVRVQVGDGHYLKGMAMYKDDLPPGVDLVFNTNKTNTGNKLDAMKKLESDPDYPFGSVVRQVLANQGTSKERVTSAMNLVYEAGDWDKWSENLSSQILSKQSPNLAKAQLDITYEKRKKEFDRINALTNPVVKKRLLESFATGSDSAAVHLKAAALPRSNWFAILPINSLAPTKVYAPNYNDGEKVVLIRYPHGGTFEIPELTVDNKNREARRLLGDAKDAIGIHHQVAQRLSGADFDGDTVLVVPNNARKIRHSPALEELKKFDPQSYKYPEGSPKVKINKQQEMGKVSNLITDMTLKGAPHSKIVRAIRHSMVVIDAEKHNLNYKLSAERNGIAALKEEYQGGKSAGAATLISRKKSITYVPDRKLRPQSQGGPIDPKTGKKIYVETGKTRRDKDGNIIPKQLRVKKLAETDDAHTLTGKPVPTRMEMIYADHSNRMKALANEARLAAFKTPHHKWDPSAARVYKKEVDSLNAKLALVVLNRPLERQAHVISRAIVKSKIDANPNLDKDSIKKIQFKELENARIRTGAKSRKIIIEPEEWNAIQAGAISESKLTQILAKADLDVVRKLATPRRKLLMTPSKTARAQQMLARGATRAEVARALGVSLTTLDTAIGGE